MSERPPLLTRLRPHPLGAWLILAEAGEGDLVAAQAGREGLFLLRRSSARVDEPTRRFLAAPGHDAIPVVLEHSHDLAVSPLTLGTPVDALLRAPGAVPLPLAAHLARRLLPAFARMAERLPDWSPDPGRVFIDLDGRPRLDVDLYQLNPGPVMAVFDRRFRWCTPEQIRGAGRDHADAWYAAVILHDLRAGAPLFGGDGLEGVARQATVDNAEVAASHLEEDDPRDLVRDGLRLLPELRPDDRVVRARLDDLAGDADDADLGALADALDDEREAARDLIEELAVLA